MNSKRLLQHFDRLSEAPDAIPRLRRFILDLAVRGQLVEQDPDDEPAIELLKGVMHTNPPRKKVKKLNGVHELPNGWVAVALGWVLNLKKGKKPPSLNESGFGYPYLDIAALERGEIRQYTEDESAHDHQRWTY